MALKLIEIQKNNPIDLGGMWDDTDDSQREGGDTLGETRVASNR